MAAASSSNRIGSLLRQWRARRRLTQLDLALDAGISARHLSFLETGRSRPSPEMVLRLAERLEVPVRERNHLLLAAGYAPAFPEHAIDDPEMAPVREALDLILDGHEPYPAVVVDRRWNLIALNETMATLSATVDPQLFGDKLNVMRIGLHPRGLAAQIVNLTEVRRYFLGRLERQVAITGDPDLAELLAEVSAYPPPEHDPCEAGPAAVGNIITPLIRMRVAGAGDLSLFVTVATFGTATEVTTSELSIELAFPADAASAQVLEKLPRR